jgi:hypothetical protein
MVAEDGYVAALDVMIATALDCSLADLGLH